MLQPSDLTSKCLVLQVLTCSVQLSALWEWNSIRDGYATTDHPVGGWDNSAPAPQQPLQTLCLPPKLCGISIPLATEQSLHPWVILRHESCHGCSATPSGKIRILCLTFPEVKLRSH